MKIELVKAFNMLVNDDGKGKNRHKKIEINIVRGYLKTQEEFWNNLIAERLSNVHSEAFNRGLASGKDTGARETRMRVG